MRIEKYTAVLKDGRTYGFKSIDVSEAEEMLDLRYKTSQETDFLTRYPEEILGTCVREFDSIKDAEKSERDVFLGAYDGERLIGSAHVFPISKYQKFAHRCELGILVSKDYWSRGVGKKLIIDAIKFAEEMGYTLMQLETFDKNERGIGLYEHMGFTRVGQIPFGGLRKDGTYYEEVIMYKVLSKNANNNIKD